MERSEKWTETYVRLSKADQDRPLEPKDLEILATAAYLTGRDAEWIELLGRAHQGYLDRKNIELAVRCAFWLGMILMNAGEKSRGSGWIGRGERLLSEHKPDCSEKGLLLIPTALGALFGGNAEKANELFEQAISIGERFSDADLMALGRLGHGQAMIQQGNVAKGIKLLDEAMITVEADKVFPVVNGIVYCAVIETCRKVWDLKRAQEWTSVLTRWCDSHPDLVPFRGQCLVRRAEIMQFHGEWHKALEETQNACKLLTRPPGEPAAGEAYYREAELFRLLGDFERAEDSYRKAAKWGKNPQPGLALLRLIQGQADAAQTSIRNTLQEAKGPKARADLLPAVVRIMIAANQTEEACIAAEELNELAINFDVPYLHATSAYARGAVLLAAGNFRQALEQLQKASNIWNALDLPYESALTRELIGLTYNELADRDNSDMELAAAKWVFEQLRAAPDMERIDRLINKRKKHKIHGLTLRELQVLRRVASGMTNNSVAGELFISERTVDRHMSNIFNKLGVSSRVAATTYAIRHNIVENKHI